jgi:hypothetical protein
VDAPEDSPEGKYIRSRFTPEQIDQWRIRLAPEGWQFLTNKALEQQYKREFLVQTGIIRESEKKEAKLYDFFRQRMMIPVHNTRGQVIAYTARVFPHADTDQKGNKLGKWVNSVGSDIFQKDRTLFGLYQAREAIEKQGIDVRVMTAIPTDKVAEPFIRRRALRHIEKGSVVVCVGGTGNPYFTTDSCAVLRGLELACDVVVKATKVDGIYDKDPKKHTDAVRHDELHMHEVLKKDIRVMDQAAIALAHDE